jgi:hypothetical protein
MEGLSISPRHQELLGCSEAIERERVEIWIAVDEHGKYEYCLKMSLLFPACCITETITPEDDRGQPFILLDNLRGSKNQTSQMPGKVLILYDQEMTQQIGCYTHRYHDSILFMAIHT